MFPELRLTCLRLKAVRAVMRVLAPSQKKVSLNPKPSTLNPSVPHVQRLGAMQTVRGGLRCLPGPARGERSDSMGV